MNPRRNLLLAGLALLPLIALSNHSLWIDEAHSALKAMQPSLSSWWQVLVSEKGSDLQMPLYMFYLWVWEKIAGHSELALRLANLPWLVLAHYALYRLCRRRGCDPLPLLAIASINPFLWFYLNEARPYLMQYAGSCMVLCGLGGMFAPARKNATRLDFWFFVTGILVLAGSSLLATLWAASAIAAFAFLSFHLRRRLPTKELLILGAILILLTALAAFYLWTLWQGARGSNAGQMEIRNVPYAAFQLLGFSGLGPGVLRIREFGPTAFHRYLPLLLTLAALLCVVIAQSLRTVLLSAYRASAFAGLIYGVTPAISLITFAFIANFRLLGRHFAPLSPLIVIVVAVGLIRCWQSRQKIVVLATCLLWLASALELRFSSRHQKDDYRSAAAEARRGMSEGNVWWAADRAAATYYQLPIWNADAPISLVINSSSAELQKLPRPDTIILSKPDLYDENHAIRAYLTAERFQPVRRLPAFSVWRR